MPLSFSLPRRRKVVKSGIQRAERKVWPRHRRFVKSHGCCVPGCRAIEIDGVPLDFAHVVTVGAGGHDREGVSLCRLHHIEQHRLGIKTFQAKYNIDLRALAAEFVKRSPDVAMRAALVGEG